MHATLYAATQESLSRIVQMLTEEAQLWLEVNIIFIDYCIDLNYSVLDHIFQQMQITIKITSFLLNMSCTISICLPT